VSADSLLALCLEALEWSPERLAREINRTQGNGTISPKAPYGWLKGACPRGQLPQVVARLLSDRLDRQISPAELWPALRSGQAVQVAADDGLTGEWTQEGFRGALSTLIAENQHSVGRGPAAIAPGHLTRYTASWAMSPRDTLSRNAHGPPITTAMIEALAVRILQLRHMDDAQGGTTVLDWAVHELRWVAELLIRSSYSEEAGILLCRISAELAQLAGWLACDAEQPGRAHRYWLIALRAAHAGDDPAMGANVASCMAYQEIWSGRGKPALQIIEHARRRASNAPPALSALLASRQGRAYALIRDEAACGRALNGAREYGEEATPRNSPSWGYWVTPAVLTADAGRAWLELDRPDHAEENLRRGVELFGQSQPRNRLLHQASLAEARLALGDIHGAVDAAHHAVSLSAGVVSHRTRTRLRSLENKFRSFGLATANEMADEIAFALTATR
jgi:hypothetical protein